MNALLLSVLLAAPPTTARPDTVVHGGEAWQGLVADSERYVGRAGGAFEPWLDREWKRITGERLDSWVRVQTRRLQTLKGLARRRDEIRLAGDLHRIVKRTIPKFNLDRGYEFAYTASRGERQCLLQSVLISALLERMGVRAGIAMVWRNPAGKETNLGHVVSLVRPAGGGLVVVDASEKESLSRPLGLFGRLGPGGTYRFVSPRYGADEIITGVTDAGTGRRYGPEAFRALGVPYVRSQFLFYRAERVRGGLLAAPASPAGLAESERWMRRSVALAPENPLAVYSLGRVLYRQGKLQEAANWITRGQTAYQKAGKTFPSVGQMLAAIRRDLARRSAS